MEFCVRDEFLSVEKGFSRDKKRLLRLLEFDGSILYVMCVQTGYRSICGV